MKLFPDPIKPPSFLHSPKASLFYCRIGGYLFAHSKAAIVTLTASMLLSASFLYALAYRMTTGHSFAAILLVTLVEYAAMKSINLEICQQLNAIISHLEGRNPHTELLFMVCILAGHVLFILDVVFGSAVLGFFIDFSIAIVVIVGIVIFVLRYCCDQYVDSRPIQ